jgi:hypothetical protein
MAASRTRIPKKVHEITQAAQGAHSPVVSVETVEEDLPIGDITTLGWLYLRNLDTTNYVTYGPKSGGAMVAFGRIKPGEPALMRLEPGITLRWVANTAAVKIQVKLFQD